MYKTFLKRPLDFILSLFLMVLLLPVFILISILVKVSSKGPVFFTQERVGKNGRIFRILKFRSMRVDTEAEKKGFEPGTRSRITPVGAFLRKTKLDELPQFINVIKGDMSLVGPRPEVKSYVDIYPERWREVLCVRPGITDEASISFKDEEEILAASNNPEKKFREEIMPAKLEIYKNYVENISLSRDIKILMETFSEVFVKR